jgi:hypothetical protein
MLLVLFIWREALYLLPRCICLAALLKVAVRYLLAVSLFWWLLRALGVTWTIFQRQGVFVTILRFVPKCPKPNPHRIPC